MRSLKTRILVPTSLLVIIAVSILSYAWVDYRENRLLQHYQTSLQNVTELHRSRFTAFFEDVGFDLLFMADSPELKNTTFALANTLSGHPDTTLENRHIPQMKALFMAYMAYHTSAFQVRYLDTHKRGFEMVRVDRLKTGIEIVADEKLQFKEHRDYYQASLPLKPGELYYSALNLNREYGEIEKPHRPTLRIATGMFEKNTLYGILIINIDARVFFEQLILDVNQHLKKTGIDTLIANNDGFWLLHSDQSRTFGFDHGNDHRVQSEFPDLDWTAAGTDNQQTIRTVKLANNDYLIVQPLQIGLKPEQRTYHLFYRIPASLIAQDKQQLYQQIAIVTGLVMLFLLLPQYLLLSRFLRPIHQLVNVAQAIGHGHYNKPLPAAHDRETMQLNHAINSLRKEVSERELSLQESENRNNIIIENIPLGIAVANEKGIIIRSNAHLATMYGYDDDAILNLPIDILTDPEHNETLREKVKRLDQADQLEQLDEQEFFEATHKDGSTFPVHINITPVIFNHQPHLLLTCVDITQKIQAEKKLWHQANFDELTQLPNRKLFYELLAQEQKIALRQKKTLWLLFLDLDGFKEINDSYGHDVGDLLLIEVAKRLKHSIRESDILARLGGDEFVILLSNVESVAGTEKIAGSIIKKLATKFLLNDIEVFISTSIGIASFPNDADNTSDLLRFADQAMYQAKAEGKNRLHYFTDALQQASLLRMQIANDLRKAIIKNELMLMYQPIVNIATQEVYKAEALIRWIHPEKGIISPLGFIPIAEETGVIHDIGAWTFNEVFKQFETLSEDIRQRLRISINFSPLQLAFNEDTYDNWMDELSKHGLAGENIIIECTEGLLLKNEPQVNRRLLDYRDKNIAIAIDDFGTGYSSLAYLKEFDIDFIKIDQSFIRNMKPASSEESLVEAIIVMAHKLHMQVIAEGVETEEQLNMLKAMECDFAQGYLFSKPVAGDVFIQDFLGHRIRTIEGNSDK